MYPADMKTESSSIKSMPQLFSHLPYHPVQVDSFSSNFQPSEAYQTPPPSTPAYPTPITTNPLAPALPRGDNPVQDILILQPHKLPRRRFPSCMRDVCSCGVRDSTQDDDLLLKCVPTIRSTCYQLICTMQSIFARPLFRRHPVTPICLCAE